MVNKKGNDAPAYVKQMQKIRSRKREQQPSDLEPAKGTQENPWEKAQAIVNEDPRISPNTLINKLKAEGFELMKKEPTEADTSAGNEQVLRGEKMKQSKAWKAAQTVHRFLELKAEKPAPGSQIPDDLRVKQEKMRNLVNPGDKATVLWNQIPMEIIIDKKSVDGSHIYGTVLSGERKGERISVPYENIEKVSQKQCDSFQFLSAQFKEAAASDDGIGHTKFGVVLIREGLGNFKDRYYYTKEALEGAVHLFEGKKIYADHPSDSEETDRPERSVRDVLGYFENVRIAQDEDGTAMIEADVLILPEHDYAWARGLMKQAIQYSKKFSDKEFVGLSINANGTAEVKGMEEFLKETEIPESAKAKLIKAQEKGIEDIRVVTSITDAVSTDLVTEAGAGGRVTNLIERGKPMKEQDKHPAEDKEQKKGVAENEEQDMDKKDEMDDMELVKDIVAKYMGEGDHDESVMEVANEAYQAAKAMGYEGEELEKATGYGMKMMQYMAEKYEKEAEKPEDKKDEEKPEDKKENEEVCDKKESEEADKEEEKPEDKKEEAASEETKESAKTAKLSGRLAMLESKLLKYELKEHLDGKLEKSKLPWRVTKMFRESLDLGKVKNAKEIDDKFEQFLEGYKFGSKEGSGLSDFTINVEKRGEATGEGVAFDDCLS